MKENKHETVKAVLLLFVGAVAYALIGDLNTLVLAHVWPVTIHFGDFSFNNFLFIFVAVLSTIILSLLLTALCIAFLFSSIADTFSNLFTPKDQRKSRKTRWFEYPVGYLFWASVWLSARFMPLFRRKHELKKAARPTLPNTDENTAQTEAP
jgi:hypothetical protein